MIIPLVLLSIGTIFSGLFLSNYFVGSDQYNFWFSSLIISQEYQQHIPFFQTFIIKLFVATGIVFAAIIYFYKKELSSWLSYNLKPLYFISYNKWYVDELFKLIFVRPYFFLASFLWKRGDQGLIDAYGPDGISKMVKIVSKNCSKFQTGFLYHYAFTMIGGLVFILTWFIYT